SAISRLVEARDGYDLMPELGYKPVNKYLPPRKDRAQAGCTGAPAKPLTDTAAESTSNKLLRWLDRALSR
ncbi:MAG TPA: ferredoxin, partial [Dongiaceae bacterium]